MTDTRTYVPCRSCKSLRFEVLHEAKAGVAHIICGSCGAELMSVTMAPPEEQQNTRAPI